jgi:signal transduction histidine kinase
MHMPDHDHTLLKQRLSQHQLQYLTDNLPSSLIAVIVGIVAMVVVFNGVIDTALLTGWVITASLVVIFRFSIYIWLKRNINNVAARPLAKSFIIISATATGILWGLASILFSMPTDMFYWVFLAFFMSGYASGAVFSTAALLPACAGYLFPTLIPITIWFFFQDDGRAPLMGTLLAIFTFAAWNMAKNAHRIMVDNVEVQTQLQLAKQQIQLHDEKNKALQTMAGGIAHDLNNTLTGIIGNLYLAQREPHLSPNLQHKLETMQTGLSAATAMGRKMLDYSNASLFTPEEINLPDLIQSEIMPQHDIAAMNIHLEVQDNIPLFTGDAKQQQQVIYGLLFNACESYHDDNQNNAIFLSVKHHDKHVIQNKIEWDSLNNDVVIELEIKDHGCGMSQHVIDHIYDPFFTTKFTGRGLGMSVVYGSVKRMKGKIAITSNEGHGSSVCIYFPAIDEH